LPILFFSIRSVKRGGVKLIKKECHEGEIYPMRQEYWNWLNLELKIPQFAIFRIFNGVNLIRLFVKIKEEVASREELNFSWNWKTFEESYHSLIDFDKKIKKVDFKDRYILYSSGSELIQIKFYFSKENWKLFFDFIKRSFEQFSEQRREFKQKFGRKL